MKRVRQRKLVRRTAITRNAAVTDVRLHKPVLTDARLTAVRAAAAMFARSVTMTTVTTGRRSVFRPMPAAQATSATARANVRPGPASPVTINPAAAVSAPRLVKIRPRFRQMPRLSNQTARPAVRLIPS